MLRAMKVLILSMLRKVGYVVMKNASYERLQYAATHGLSPVVIKVTKASPEVEMPKKAHQINRARGNLPAEKYDGLLAALRNLNDAQVRGDIVDCGSGKVATLSTIGAMLLEVGNTDRRLIGLDVSGDPTHRTEKELLIWGGSNDLLSEKNKHRSQYGRETSLLPGEFVDSGYPIENIRLLRDPLLRTIRSGFPEEIAFLLVTSETYPANREALKLLFERITIGGGIAVEVVKSAESHSDVVDEFLQERGLKISFKEISKTYRIGFKSDANVG